MHGHTIAYTYTQVHTRTLQCRKHTHKPFSNRNDRPACFHPGSMLSVAGPATALAPPPPREPDAAKPSSDAASVGALRVSHADAPPEVMEFTTDAARKCLQARSLKHYSNVAKELRAQLSERYKGTWHCIVGKSFGSMVTQETGQCVCPAPPVPPACAPPVARWLMCWHCGEVAHWPRAPASPPPFCGIDNPLLTCARVCVRAPAASCTSSTDKWASWYSSTASPTTPLYACTLPVCVN